jgi:hypothetical protein
LRYQARQQLPDLEEYIQVLGRVAEVAPANDQNFALCRSMVATGLTLRYQRLNSKQDLARAIQLQEQILAEASSETERCYSLHHLADSLLLRYQSDQSSDDLNTAVVFLKEAQTIAEQNTWSDAGELAEIKESLAHAVQQSHED